MIRFDQVTRTYGSGEKPALHDISVEFLRGDFVFLIGASGSGKSTLLRMILREGLPSRGRVTVAGQNLAMMLERRVPQYRRSIGMVFQDFRLLPDRTIFENVAFAMRVTGAKRTHIRPRVTKTLQRVGLEHLARRYPHEISGGEQQRAAIARAVVNKPSILLADEPTGNLDPRASEEVMNILRRINDAGTTVIMATHDRAIVDSMSRRVVQLHRGELVRDEQPGTYDPPAGSRAWKALIAEESSSGLRAQDPIPLRTEAVPTVAEQDPAASEPSATSAPSAEEADPAARPEAIYRVTWPGDDTDDEHFQERVLPEEDVEPDTAPNPRVPTHTPEESAAPAEERPHAPRLGWLSRGTDETPKPRLGGAAAESEESERFSFRRDPGGSNDA
ncbi:cell division ATP-binding protein FtsE [Nesterenkonia sp. NBAIMH1]|uniref:cell division ATP-binding protein FtsE n=1 Tax=Nesterenkonia sp. NBAIMH1 TaxID=2600320 RepID=UPI0011B788CE|nr:cell division ATP-binding protein FtsE [Nesterenkonia sp. NBAIMH1]